MKQKKDGKKIQNWHKSLGPSQLRQRYRRLKMEDPENTHHAGLLKQVDELYNGQYCDVCGSPDSCGCRECWDYDDPADENRITWSHRQLVAALTEPQWLIPLRWAIELQEEFRETNDCGRLRQKILDVGVEQELFNYAELLGQCPATAAALKAKISDSILNPETLDVIRPPHNTEGHDVFLLACLFSPFWIRSPSSWQGGDSKSLISHLFVLHDVPEFLYAEWSVRPRPDNPRLKWLCWFLLFAQGGSLRKAADLFDWIVPSRLSQFLLQAPSEATATQACIFAEIRRLGGSEIDFRRIIRNPAFVVDPTERSDQEGHSKFWHDTVRWVIKHSDQVTDEECDLILTWAMHEYTEFVPRYGGRRLRQAPFVWKGRTLRPVLERSIQYREEVSRPWASYRWQGHGWDWEFDDPNSGKWTFIELTSGEQLFDEGQSLRHCVAGYAARCASGHSAIVSVKCNEVRLITVEICPSRNRIVQSRGSCNRSASAAEKKVIDHWLNTVVQKKTHAVQESQSGD